MATAAPTFTIERTTAPVAAEQRAELLKSPGFGTLFTDHMAIVRYREG